MEENKTEVIKEEFRLEEAFDRIDKLLERLNDREVPLEESFTLYQEGMQLLKQCNDRIDHVERQMLQIDEEGNVREFS